MSPPIEYRFRNGWITPYQRRLLDLLLQPRTIGELVQLMASNPVHLRKTLTKLIAAGWVEKTFTVPDPRRRYGRRPPMFSYQLLPEVPA